MNSTRQDQFLEELRELMKKYDVKVYECDNYDGRDNWDGKTVSFYGRDINLEIDESLNP